MAPDETQHVPDMAPVSSDRTQHVPDLPSFGRYRATTLLGTGASGTVYRAIDDVLGREVAIKTLHARGPSVEERFLREAKAIGTLVHPHVLSIFDAGVRDGTPYQVIEIAPGGSLREHIRTGALAPAVVRRIGIQIARALAASHAAGILHRDVKPANVLAVADDRWKLADFGIARLPDSTLTATGMFLGSPAYAAPEALRGGMAGAPADVYGLGATLYEALTGSTPRGDRDLRAMFASLDEPAPPLHERCAAPRTMTDAIMRALAKEPSARPRADELATLLAATHEAPRTTPQPTRRSRGWIIVAVVTALLVALAVASGDQRAPSAPPASVPSARPAYEQPSFEQPTYAEPPGHGKHKRWKRRGP